MSPHRPRFAFGTKEWSVKSINITDGCKHDCKYCFAKEFALRFHRCKRPAYWRRETVTDKYKKLSIKKYNGPVMYPTSHDIQPENLYHHLFMLDTLLLNGNEVLIVLKPHFKVVKAICKRYAKYKDNIIFRFTIGSIKNSILKFWEPYAPSFDERLKSLAYAYKKGFRTSVSCEPFLDRHVEDTFRRLKPFISDSFWIGTGNRMRACVGRNTSKNKEALRRLEKLMEKAYTDEYVKHLYARLGREPLIRWKDSTKNILGLTRVTKPGLNR